ncbi:MAG TPA: hypothetical protein DEQ32_04775 [Gammaproteobacteria bacterium]|nr:hypothetical protein [Gammaproteobacteria bacterium]
MKHSVRLIETKGSKREIRKLSVASDRLTLGRGTDQSIQIADKRLPLAHSTLILKDESVEIRGNSSVTFTVNGQASRRAQLVPGDIAEIAGHTLEVLAEDGTLVLQIEIGDTQFEPLRDRFTTRLRELDIKTRSLSWALFLVILAAGAIIPSAGFFVGMETLREAPLPDDGIWLSGDLHPTHAFLGDNCEACHTTPFVSTRQEDCLACHSTVQHHFATDLFGHDYFVGDTCQDCHREHNGPEAITRSDQATCTGCHTDLERSGYPSLLLSATDFESNHPDFKISTLRMQEDKSWQSIRFNLSDEGLTEVSNLKFPHDVHMDSEGLMGPDGTVNMACGDCHTPEKGGMRMQTVTMENHCASCHELTFDPDVPDRVVPHGNPTDLINMLRGYYAYQYFQQNDSDDAYQAIRVAPEPTRQARRPGARRQSIAGFQRELPAQAGAQEAKSFVDDRVDEAASTLFEKRTCVICHELAETSRDGRWEVIPVKLTADWMPLAEFTHDPHKTMACEDCHEASTSNVAADVLMPDIDSCRTCHGGEHTENKLQSTCIACHGFHLDNQAPMSVLLSVDQSGNLIDQSGRFVDKLGNILDGSNKISESSEL